MYKLRPTTRFQKDLKRIKKRGYDLSLLTKVINFLAEGKPLPTHYKDHSLSGDYTNCRECYILPDWLLIYEIDHEDHILYLVRVGTHSDLF